jgi:Na+-translocating ferredoxin:NAD+ oxidoreductase subunit G
MKKNGFVAPVVVLTIICLVVSGLLGYINSITDPIITEANAKSAEEAKKEVLPDADSFTDVSTDNLPEEVVTAALADNGAGAVYILDGAGYGGTMEIIVGIGSDGTITGTKVLSHSETAGLGARVANEDFRSQFVGEDSSLSDVELISGSTISSKCFKGLVEAAFEANDILAEEGN